MTDVGNHFFFGNLSLIGKAVVLKTTSSRVKLASPFESGDFRELFKKSKVMKKVICLFLSETSPVFLE